jgi:hypothetical protein
LDTLNSRSYRSGVPRGVVLVPISAAIAGLVVVLTVGSLLGAALIIGGVMALGIMMIPAVIERVAAWLSTGRLRRF